MFDILILESVKGGKTILPLVTQSIPVMLASPDWKQRHAALMALGAIGEGCQKQMETMLQQLMDGVPGVMSGILTYASYFTFY